MSVDWPQVSLADVVSFRGGGTPSKGKKSFWIGSIPWVSPKDMKDRWIRDSMDHVTEQAVEQSSTRLLPAGSVLVVVRSGILARTVPIGIAAVPLTVNQDLKALCPTPSIDSEYLCYWLQSIESQLLEKVTRSATVHRITVDVWKSLRIPLPPLTEQKRIVAILDEAFEAIERAEGIGTQSLCLGRNLWDASVLACTTGVVQVMHEEGEDGHALLERILSERRDLWETAEKEKLAAAPGRARRSAYSDPALPDLAEVPELPAGWAWASLDQLAYFIVDYRGKTPPKSDSGVPVVSAANVGLGQLDLSDPRYVSQETYEKWTVRGLPRGGDVFITTEAPVGRAAIYPDGDVLLPTRRVLLTRINGCEPRFLMHALLSGFPAQFIQRNSRHRGATVPRILKPKLLETPIPLPPQRIQRQIVSTLQALEQSLDKRRDVLTRRTDELQRLRSSILRQAFLGELNTGRRNPEVRPAEVLA